MLYTRTETIGVDTPIDGFQRWLYPKILSAWGLLAESDSNKAYNSYSRAYRNQTKDGYIPEVYIGDNEYSNDLFLDDRIKALSFFNVADNTPFVNGRFSANVSLVFSLNLAKISPGADRQDEKVRQSVIQIVQNVKLFGFQFTGVETGMDSVFREYTGTRSNDGLKYRDMHPFHSFRLNFTVVYKSNC